jgi:23S rRNA (adenine2503-C2)-methyltransferase
MIPISALLPDQLAETLSFEPRFRSRQVFAWIHRNLVFDFTAMSDLPEVLRRELSQRTRSVTLETAEVLKGEDGTVKLGFRLHDGNTIESVLMQDERGRRTACLSTQVGCAMACRFCRTGAHGYGRDLEDFEIVEQYLLLRRYVRAEMKTSVAREIANVVFMGMGEPLANLDNLEQAVKVLTCPSGSALSPRRLTVSTCGLVQGIRSLVERGLGARLAVSLVSAEPRVRNKLMPVSKANPLRELRGSLSDYQRASGKRITLEIVLMAGLNDRPEDIEALVRFVAGERGQRPLKVLVNLIPWNPVPEFPYLRPDSKRLDWFQRRLEQAGIPATTRLSRGSSICGACGQLG